MTSISMQIKILLLQKNIRQSDLAKSLGMTQQNISLKFKKDNYKISELLQIASILDSKITITAINDRFNTSEDITSSLLKKNYHTSEIIYIANTLGFKIEIHLIPNTK